MAEYESMVLGLKTARKIGIKMSKIVGDLELVINQVKKQCQAKHPKLR